MTTIYMDESGFTGDDLIEDKQPHFVIGSTIIDDAEADTLLRTCFPRYKGKDFKFKNLWRRREANQSGFQAFAQELPNLSDRMFLWIIDKRFALLTKMCDYLLEPGFQAAGFDYYGDGYAMRYMNTVYRDVVNVGGPKILEEPTRRWNDFARNPSAGTMGALRQNLHEIERNHPHPVSTIFAMLVRGTEHFEASNPLLEDFVASNEMQVTSILSTVMHWRQNCSDELIIAHDESKSFESQRELWDTITRNDYTVPAFELSNGTLAEMPLRVHSTNSLRSEDSPAIQLTDVLAGLGAKIATNFDQSKRDPFVMDLIEKGAGALTSGGIRPHDDYVKGLMPRKSGPDALDRMTGILEPWFKNKRPD